MPAIYQQLHQLNAAHANLDADGLDSVTAEVSATQACNLSLLSLGAGLAIRCDDKAGRALHARGRVSKVRLGQGGQGSRPCCSQPTGKESFARGQQLS